MNIARSYASLGRMLDYPWEKEAILEDYDRVNRSLQVQEAVSPLASFARFVNASSLARLQEEYVATFDFNPAVAPYLGHHLFGDSQKKGAYLIRLKHEFALHGFSSAGKELPDHLPLLLGFLAYLAGHADDGVRRSFISECVLPGLDRLAAGFSARKDSPWKAVVEATRILCAVDTDAREEGHSG